MDLVKKQKAKKNIESMLSTNNQVILLLSHLKESYPMEVEEIQGLTSSVKHLQNMNFVLRELIKGM
jgi:hypothetical protein